MAVKLTKGELRVLRYMLRNRVECLARIERAGARRVEVALNGAWYPGSTSWDSVWSQYGLSPTSLRSLQKKGLVEEKHTIFTVTKDGIEAWEKDGKLQPIECLLSCVEKYKAEQMYPEQAQ